MPRTHAAHPEGADLRTGRPRTLCGICVQRPRPALIYPRWVNCPNCLARAAGDPEWRRAHEPGRPRLPSADLSKLALLISL